MYSKGLGASAMALGHPPQTASAQRSMLSEYHVGKCIGVGAFGEVFACKRQDMGVKCAMKVVDMKQQPAGAFLNELYLMAKIEKSGGHENILGAHSWFFEGDFGFMVMPRYVQDLMDGLAAHSQFAGNIHSRDFVHIAFQMGSAVEFLHSRAIVHRDVKTENFLIDRINVADRHCCAVLSDFGAAAFFDGKTFKEQVGTSIYWAPEILCKNYGMKVDVWALGIIIFGALMAVFPFANEHEIQKKCPKMSQKLDPQCQDFIIRLLVKAEEGRPSAQDVMEHSWLQPVSHTSSQPVFF